MASSGCELTELVRLGTTVPRSYGFGTKVLGGSRKSRSLWASEFLRESRSRTDRTRLTLPSFRPYDGKLPSAGVAQW
jgi:hypothetical protein